MRSMLINDAAEYNAATDRVNSALQTLRDEMKSLRHQDMTLMRQFITMNDAIRCISKDQKTEKSRKKRLRNRSRAIDAASLVTESACLKTPTLVRQQSVPRFCDVIPEERTRTWSGSSDELSESSQDESSSDSVTSSDCDVSSDDERLSSAVPVFQTCQATRQRSKSMKTRSSSSHDCSYVTNVLNRNVKLWKGRQARKYSDSVFLESCPENKAEEIE